MLYLVACGRAGGQVGQDGVVHLVSRASRLSNLGRRCVFTDANAAAAYAEPSEELQRISEVLDWSARPATDWRDPVVKAARQAEFLVADVVPCTAFEAKPTTRKHIEKVLRLIEGFEDPYGLELLATIHWIMRKRGDVADDPHGVAMAVRDWSDRKARMLKTSHIEAAWERLRHADSAFGVRAPS